MLPFTQENLTKKEVFDLFEKYRSTGEIAYKNKIWKSNIKLVISIVNSYCKSYKKTIKKHNIDIEDLTQEGLLGLERAIEKFDHTKGYCISTYSSFWIKEFVKKYITTKGGIISVPKNVQKMRSQVSEFVKNYKEEFAQEPSKEEIVETLKISNNFFQPVRHGSEEFCELNANITTGSFDDSLNKEVNLFNKIRNLLSKKEEQILRLRLGIF